MAATIEKEFGTQFEVVLKEGHSGIFEVSMDCEVIYSNSSQCGRLPAAEDILGRIRHNSEFVEEIEIESCSCEGG